MKCFMGVRGRVRGAGRGTLRCACVNGRPDYESILNELSTIRRRKGDLAMPFSFVSKFIAMHDDGQPIYDRHVCSLFGVQSPPASVEKGKRIEWFVWFLSCVQKSYENWAIDPRMANVSVASGIAIINWPTAQL